LVFAVSPVAVKLRFGPLYIEVPPLNSSYPVAPATAFHVNVIELLVMLEAVGAPGAGSVPPPPAVVTLVAELKFDVTLALYALTVKL